MTSPWPFYQYGVDILGPLSLASGQLKFLIMGVNYFTKRIEAKKPTNITLERVPHFYWKKIICRFRLSGIIVSDNITQLSRTIVIDLCCKLDVQMKFFYVVHLQSNRQAESTNKVILKRIKKKLDETRGLWAELLHEKLWSYNTTPNSTNRENLFTLVNGEDTKLYVAIDMPSWCHSQFN